MRRKLLIILPLLQVAVAAGLLILANYQHHGVRGREYVFSEPATHLAHAISAPAMLFRFVAVHLWSAMGLPYSYLADEVVFVVGVGILWSAIGFEMDSGLSKWRSSQPSLFSIRTLIDVGMIMIGILCGFGGIGAWSLIHWQFVSQAAIEAALYSGWAVILIAIYGRDLLFRVLNWRRPVKDGAFPIE